MERVKRILSNVLLALQLCLGLWQFVKLTPMGGLVQGGMGWFLSLLMPFRLSSAYAQLQSYPGRIFKQVRCVVMTKAAGSQDELIAVPTQISVDSSETIEFSYLGRHYHLQKRDGNKLFIDHIMSYYITDAIWQNLMQLQFLSKEDVLIKDCKDFWEMVVTGGVMTLSEALDLIILENQPIMSTDNAWLLPVNLTVSEEKLLKVLNLVGLFLQTQKVFWLIPTFFSFASAILEFNTTLRVWLYTNINKLFCWSMHLICDTLSYSKRRQVYSLGKWVENFKPCNDIELRVVRGNIRAVLGGAAKSHKEDVTLVPVPWFNVDGHLAQTFDCDPIQFRCEFLQDVSKCGVGVLYPNKDKPVLLLDCKSRDEFMKICTFVGCVANNRSGSLKSYHSHNKVLVRGWKESVRHYVKSGFPRIYELNLEHVIVTGI